ncbi:AIR synthase-related protein [Streptomyces sp. NPDC023723]|uniref:AIR synthase-related protein n=1 Tax=Streptomyces sp. NPDC023723 TaxID=3154323 RepID=UPI0034117C5B
MASDSRLLHRLRRTLVSLGGTVQALCDPTRGGSAAALNEIARASTVAVEIEEQAVSVPWAVAPACDLLGPDPLIVADEGCLVAFIASGRTDEAPADLRSLPFPRAARPSGSARSCRPGHSDA